MDASFVGTNRRRLILLAWALVVLIASPGALQVGSVLKGGSDGVPGSESVAAVDDAVSAGISAGVFYPFLAVLHSDAITTNDPRFAAAAHSLAAALMSRGHATAVRSFWNSGDQQLLGRSGRTALLLIRPDVASFAESEVATAGLRQAVLAAQLPAGISCKLTGQSAVFYDLNRRTSADLLRAERIGLPVTLGILLVVFGSPIAALLPIALALCALTVSMAALYLLSDVMVVSVFAENTVSMIGLGVGIDYSLFLLASFRRAVASGMTPEAAARAATREVASAIAYSGATVAVGFAALCLVRLPFLKALAFGGILVVATSVLATLTLLPALLAQLGARVNWPRNVPSMRSQRRHRLWTAWAHAVTRAPLISALVPLLVIAMFIAPVFRMASWDLGASALAADLEARSGYDLLRSEFAAGWMGPTALVIEAAPGRSVLDERSRAAIGSVVQRLQADPRVFAVRGYPELLAAMRGSGAEGMGALPETLRAAAADMTGRAGKVALVGLITAEAPEAKSSARLVRDLRADAFPELAALDMTTRVSGTSAMLVDFDREIFSKLWIVIPAVLLVTYCALLIHFGSVVVPLKAIAVNLLAVLASYGFLILVFQDGHGASLIGLVPPGGLNAFIVLVLFTILFGLSMDYEVFLLTGIKRAYQLTGDNREAVTLGLMDTAGTISSAALIMVSLFVAFGFTRLVATREFGLGLAFAVALDATLVRLALVPALMVLLGRANWWMPRIWRSKPVTPR